MRIQLINAPPLDLSKSSERIAAHPPLGLLYLAAYVRQFHPEIEWKITDGSLYGFKRCLNDFDQFAPVIVGVSFTTPFATGAYTLVEEIRKRNPRVKTVAGGAHPTAMPDEVAQRFDAVVIGEGEKSFLDIIENNLSGKVVSKHIPNIDEIPFPARDLVNMAEYPGSPLKLARPETSVISTRGCAWNKCWYCSMTWKIQRPCYRARSPKSVVDEIAHLVDRYKIREYYDKCEEFNAGLSRGMEICREMMRRKLSVKWKVLLRCDKVTDEFMEMLSKAGCWLVYLGIESGNQRTLDGIRKGITLEQVEGVCRLAQKHGIKTYGFFMFFNVWEEDGELCYEKLRESMDTYDYGRKLLKDKLLNFASWQLATPFPFSPLWDTCVKFDLLPKEHMGKWENWHLQRNFLMRLPGVTQEDVQEMRRKIKGHNLRHFIGDVGLVNTIRLSMKVISKMIRDR